VAAALDRRAYAELTTSTVPTGEAFAYWREMICATFVRLAAEPVTAGGFNGRIEHVPVGDLELSTVVAGSQHVRRTRSLIAQGKEEYLLASIQQRGMGRVEQDGRAATLSPGDLAFYDSTRPYTLHFDNPFHQLVVQIPKRDLMLNDTRQLTARALGQGTAGGVVATFFTSLFGVAKGSRQQSEVLLPNAVGLLTAAASLAGRVEPGPDAAEALARGRVLAFLSSNLADPRLDAATVAKAAMRRAALCIACWATRAWRRGCAGCGSSAPRSCCFTNPNGRWRRWGSRAGSKANPVSTARSGRLRG
jgi:AraC-binding-like domain